MSIVTGVQGTTGSKSLYVGNLNYYVDENTLSEIFSTLGRVAECKIIKDKATGLSAGYGFVRFEDHRSVATTSLCSCCAMSRSIQTCCRHIPTLQGLLAQVSGLGSAVYKWQSFVRTGKFRPTAFWWAIVYVLLANLRGELSAHKSIIFHAIVPYHRHSVLVDCSGAAAGGESELGIPEGPAGGHVSTLPHIRGRSQQRGERPPAEGGLLWLP